MRSAVLSVIIVLQCGATSAQESTRNASYDNTTNALFTHTHARCISQANSDIPRRAAFGANVMWCDESLIPTNETFISSNDFIKNATKRDPTYRITQPGTYVLQENIVLDFGEPDILEHPFHFGFVMGIMISADNVRLDLNGKTIRMSDRFANRQRFFNIIELAQAPYPKGKAGFKDDIVPARNVIIENGRIGRSSHGAIHGNDNDRVLLRDLTITDFEVAAIGINNGHNIQIQRVVVDNADVQVSVHSNFAIMWMLNRTLSDISFGEQHTAAIRRQANEFLADKDFRDILQSPGSDPHRLTENTSGKPEGSMFGIYVSSQSNAGTLERDFASNYSTNVLIEDVHIRNIASGKYEMIGISVEGKPMLDSCGNRVPWTFLYDNTGVRLPLDTAELNRVKYKLAKMAVWSTSIAKPTTLPRTFVNAIVDQENRTRLAHEDNIFPQAGTDLRKGHSPKGTFGIRLDGVRNVRLKNCTIHNIVNNDTRGSSIDKNTAVYPAYPTVWNGRNGSKNVYKGNYAFGISLSSSISVDVVRSTVANVRSENGNAFGMAFIGPTRKVSIWQVNVTNTTVNSVGYDKAPAALPNLKPTAMDWYKEEDPSDIQFRNVTTQAIHSSPSNACTGTAADSTLCPGPDGWSTEKPTCGPSATSSEDNAPSVAGMLLPAALIVVALTMCALVACGVYYIRRKVHNHYKASKDPPSMLEYSLPVEHPTNGGAFVDDKKSVTSNYRSGRATTRRPARARRTAGTTHSKNSRGTRNAPVNEQRQIQRGISEPLDPVPSAADTLPLDASIVVERRKKFIE